MTVSALLLLLLLHLLMPTVQAYQSFPFYFTAPLPTNDHACACVEVADSTCEVRGYVSVPDEVDSQPSVFSPCMCWSASLTVNKTFDVFAYCEGRQNTLIQLRVRAAEPDESCMPRVAGAATCDELFLTLFLTRETRVVLPSGKIISAPRHARFADAQKLARPIPARVNATWAFFPMDARCQPFSVTLSTPVECVYDPRAIEWRFSEADVTLNTLLWAGVQCAFTVFMGSGGMLAWPNTGVVFTVGVLVAYVPCAYNLGFSQLLISLSFAMGMCSFWFAARCVLSLRRRRRWWQKFRVPDPFTLSGMGAVMLFYLFQLLIMVMMLRAQR